MDVAGRSPWIALLLLAAGLAPAAGLHAQGVPAAADTTARCDSVAARHARDSLPAVGRAARVQSFFAPPATPPRDARGHAVRLGLTFTVLPSGQAGAGTLEVTGTRDRRWIQRAENMLARTRFVAAEVEGCAVPSRMTLSVEYGPR